jgi:hypothetical protein
MEITPDKREVLGLVQQAYKGKVCLPDFQRDFVWTRAEVADLVRSIMRGYFIGSLLLLQCDPNNPPFAPAFLRGSSPTYRDAKPEWLLLDGQQRLTSLIYALCEPDLSLKDSVQRRWFFVDLNVLLTDPDSDDVVFDRTKKELRGLDKSETQYEERVLPCTKLFDPHVFQDWLDGYEDWLRDNKPGDLELFRSEWRKPWRDCVRTFQSFHVPFVALPQVKEGDSDSIGRVCAIFEKLNSTGVELSVYDLLTARLYRHDIRLHELWKDSVKAHERLRRWSKGKAEQNKFGVLSLRALALLRGLDPKPRILIDLVPEKFEHDWRRAGAAMDQALRMMELVNDDGFGVFAEKWLRVYGLVPILAALRAEIEDQKLGENERKDLRRWYWSNVFLERYSSAVESKSRKDYQELTRHWFKGGPEPDVFREARNGIGSSGFRVRDSASYASAVYSGIFCLLALRNARDWRRGENIQLQELQDHHIFPQAYLKRHGIERKVEVNTIANRTLISNETNAKIKDKAPAEYLADTDIFPSGPKPELMNPHFLDEPAIELMRSATEDLSNQEAAELYKRFLQAREAAIIREVRRVCGMAAATAPVAETVEDELDDIALDVKEGTAPLLEVDDEPELSPALGAQS